MHRRGDANAQLRRHYRRENARRVMAEQRRGLVPGERPGAYRDGFSFWPHEPDGYPRRGLPGGDADVLFERDSDALYLRDPVDLTGRDPAVDAELFDLELLGEVGALDAQNLDIGVRL